MNLNLINRHPSRRLPLKKWLKLSQSVLDCISSNPKRYPKFNVQELNVVFVNDAEIANLNWQFLKHEGATDIITFDYENGAAELLISIDTAKDSAVEHRQTFDQELLLYIVHGILHLSGFKDKSSTDRLRMRAEEKLVLNSIKVTN